jgi:hypothetical protein
MTRAEWLEKWRVQCAEWDAIGDELLETGKTVTAYEVTLEQKRRALVQGRTLVTYADLEGASS